MAEELNQPVSSQPESAPSSAQGTNAVGKPSEPVSTANMTDSQARDYYNKTQALAQQRRTFEDERKAFEAERNSWAQSRGQSQPTFQNQQPVYPQNQYGQGLPSGQNPNNPDVFKGLVDQFGYEGASAMLQTFNAITAPVQQQIAAAQQQLVQTQVATIKNEISSRGKSLFGDAWAPVENDVMEKIVRYGCPLEEAWAIVNFGKEKQAGIDAAYKNQEQKMSGNVEAPTIAPRGTTPSAVNSIDDAIRLAMRDNGAV